MQRESMDVANRLSNLNIWSRGDERAPHKPLMLIYVISRYLDGSARLLPFEEIEGKLSALLREFGRPRKTYHPEYPFWHLRSDGIWEVQGNNLPDRMPPGRSVTRKELQDARAHGGLTTDLYERVRSPQSAMEAIRVLLEREFPETYHEDILRAVAIDPDYLTIGRRRDPNFREEILRAYEYACAVCGYQSRLIDQLVGVEAAHIRWRQQGGPDTHPNGIALCALHHKLFDRGMITVTEDSRVQVSEVATGSAMFEHLVLAFHGRDVRLPVRAEYRADPRYLEWHVREVFRGPGRYLETA